LFVSLPKILRSGSLFEIRARLRQRVRPVKPDVFVCFSVNRLEIIDKGLIRMTTKDE
jgi:hypothetical protein